MVPTCRPSPPKPSSVSPGKIIRSPAGGYLVSDSKRHSIAVLASDGETLLRRIGSGERGRLDGTAERARFSEPQGICELPAVVADSVGYDMVVADTVNHVLRGLDTRTWRVTTVAGTGAQWRPGSATSGPADTVALSSPWDLAWFGDRVLIAMAGIHQLWGFDPRSGQIGVLAGTTNEGIRDGPAAPTQRRRTTHLFPLADLAYSVNFSEHRGKLYGQVRVNVFSDLGGAGVAVLDGTTTKIRKGVGEFGTKELVTREEFQREYLTALRRHPILGEQALYPSLASAS